MQRRNTTRALLALTIAGAGVGMLGGWSNRTHAAGSASIATTDGHRVYEADTTHTSVVFKIRHGGLSNFYGRFNDFKGEVHYDSASPESTRFAFTVYPDSIDTNNNSRDGHLRDADFFNSRQFKEISFVSTGLRATASGYELTGDLTLMGQTRPVTATLSPIATGVFMDTDRLGAEARFAITRSDFGMTKYLAPDNGEGGALGNTVELIVAIEAIAK